MFKKTGARDCYRGEARAHRGQCSKRAVRFNQGDAGSDTDTLCAGKRGKTKKPGDMQFLTESNLEEGSNNLKNYTKRSQTPSPPKKKKEGSNIYLKKKKDQSG